MRALIVEEGNSRSALAAGRALAEAGWVVGIGSPYRATLAAWSRSAKHWHHVPPPADGLDAFVEAVNLAVDDQSYEIVFGAGDAEVMALSARRSDIGALTPWGEHSGVACAFDKLCLSEAAVASGLAAPRTLPASSETLDLLGVPVAVKARVHSPLDVLGAPSRMPVRIVESRKDAESCADEIRDAGGDPLFQEILAGNLCALILVIHEGRAVAAVQQQADAIWPIAAGISVRAVSVAVDEALMDRCVDLLGRLEWQGLAELQFIDTGHGCLLIDLNGRFYGSMALARAAGLNLPAIWAGCATGRETYPTLMVGRPGVRYQWLEGDLRRARVAGGSGALASALTEAFGAQHSMLSLRDPLPAVRFGAHLLGRGVRKVRNA